MKKTKFTTSYKKWDIVLVSFPFTNLQSSKRRPALIISPDEYNKKADVVIVFITSRMTSEYHLGDYKMQDWKKANLPKPSMVRMKFATIDKSIIVKKIGSLTKRDREGLKKILLDFLEK